MVEYYDSGDFRSSGRSTSAALIEEAFDQDEQETITPEEREQQLSDDDGGGGQDTVSPVDDPISDGGDGSDTDGQTSDSPVDTDKFREAGESTSKELIEEAQDADTQETIDPQERQKEVIGEQLGRQIQEQTGISAQAGDEFTVEKTEEGFRAEPTQEFDEAVQQTKQRNREIYAEAIEQPGADEGVTRGIRPDQATPQDAPERRQGDVFSGFVSGYESATNQLNDVFFGGREQSIPGEGSLVREGREVEQDNVDLTADLGPVSEFGEAAKGAAQTTRRTFINPTAEVAGDTANLIEVTSEVAFSGIRTPSGTQDREEIGEGYISDPAGNIIEGEQAEQRPETGTERFVEGAVGGGLSIVNIPQYASTGVDVAEVGVGFGQAAADSPDQAQEFAQQAAGVGALQSARAIRFAQENPARFSGNIAGGAVASLGTGVAAGKALRFGRNRIRTAGSTTYELEGGDVVNPQTGRAYDPGTDVDLEDAPEARFPGAQDPDLYRSDPAEAVRQQAGDYEPEAVQQRFEQAGVEEGTTLKKALDVEPEGPGVRRKGGFETQEGTYESPGAFAGPELSPNFLGTATERTTSLRPGLPSLGGSPTGVLVRTDVENPDATDLQGLNRELLEREGETTARTKPASEVNPGEAEAIIPPEAEFADLPGGRLRNVARRAGIGSDFAVRVGGRDIPGTDITVGGRKVPLRPVADPDEISRGRVKRTLDDLIYGERGQVGGGRATGEVETRRLSEITQRAEPATDRPLPYNPVQGAETEREPTDTEKEQDQETSVRRRDGRDEERDFSITSALSPTPVSEGESAAPAESETGRGPTTTDSTPTTPSTPGGGRPGTGAPLSIGGPPATPGRGTPPISIPFTPSGGGGGGGGGGGTPTPPTTRRPRDDDEREEDQQLIPSQIGGAKSPYGFNFRNPLTGEVLNGD